jgi:hypothetical protein
VHNLVCQKEIHFNSVPHLARYREDVLLLARLFYAVNKFKEMGSLEKHISPGYVLH